jgi:hypothetical protein
MESQNGIKSWQWIVTVIVVVLIIIFGIYWISGKNSAPAPVAETPSADTSSDQNKTINNGIVVADQYPGNIAYISSVQLAQPGFVVIKKDAAGLPGKTIGSTYFKSGIHPGQVSLSESMTDGSLYYAALFVDSNNNGTLDASDAPAKDSSGKAIMKTFRATSSAQEVKG